MNRLKYIVWLILVLLAVKVSGQQRLQNERIRVNATPAFSFNYPDVMNVCAESVIVLQTENNSAYKYRWYRNNVRLNETSNALRVSIAGTYLVEVADATDNWTPSKKVQIGFVEPPKPIITSDKSASCFSEIITLTANLPPPPQDVVNWQSYQYRWYKGGVLVTNVSGSQLQITEGAVYRVEVSACSSSWVTSNNYTVIYSAFPVPKITPNKAAYCVGDQATLATDAPIDGSNTVIWERDGVTLPAETNKGSIVVNKPGKYKVKIQSKLGMCNSESLAYDFKLDAYPTISLQQIINTTLCSGETIDLKATYTGGSIKWETGPVTDAIKVSQPGVYRATVTGPGGCSITGETTVSFLPLPVLKMEDATLCQFNNEQVTLKAPSGFSKYVWNGVPGTYEFTTNKPGNIILTVTDANNCTATQTIRVSTYCENLVIPNTFSPNGDGINDTWKIDRLAADQTSIVRVYNRNGELLYQSTGYSKPWDGTHRGRPVPAGTYYYLITARSLNATISGPITVIY